VCALIVGAESRRGRVNACMSDQAQTYESAGESAKELALHLCGKTKTVAAVYDRRPVRR
jgi:hypothetical protein